MCGCGCHQDNHLLLIDLRSKGINGSKAEAVCEQASIVLNKRLGGYGWVGSCFEPSRT